MDILYKAGEDDDLSRSHLGTLVLFHIHGPLDNADAIGRYGAEDLQLLQDRGYLEQNKAGTLYKIKGMADDENEIKAMWKAFYEAYPGTKNGINAEFKPFKTRWKAGNRWRQILPVLLTELQRQIAERAAVTAYNEQMAQSGQKSKVIFQPDWKNMETYLGPKQAWLEQRPTPREVLQMPAAAPPVDHTPAAAGDSYGLYYQWALALAAENNLTEPYACSLLPLRSEFERMMAGEDLAPFIKWGFHTTRESLKRSIGEWTKEFFTNALLRNTHSALMEYYSKKYTAVYLQD